MCTCEMTDRNKKTRLCVLFGGRSSEYEVSLRSAYAVLTNADPEKYDILPVGITREGLWLFYDGSYERIADGSWCDDAASMTRVSFALEPGGRSLLLLSADGTDVRREKVDLVFPVLHGAYGEDGCVQGLLAVADIPFVGCDSESSAICMDKAATKRIVEAEGIRQAACIVLLRDLYDPDRDAARVEETLGYPVFVKPARAGSSVGVTKAKNHQQLLAAITTAFREDEKILVEEAIVGHEIEVAVLEEKGTYTASVCAEIFAGAEFYDYEAKYLSDSSSFCIPAALPEDVSQRVREYAVRIFRALGCRTLSRVDFFVEEDGGIVFNEINTLPGFTSISMYPKLMMHEGMHYSELVDRIVRSALEK